MKILLVVPIPDYPHVNPSFLSNTDFPVGFAYIAAALKDAGHKVAGLNPNNDTRFDSASILLKSTLLQALLDTNPQLIGLGGLSGDIHFINDAISLIRAVRPHIQIVCGGGIVTNDAEYVFNLLRPDFCIIGEGERAIVQLADLLEKGDSSFSSVPNLGYWVNNVAIFNDPESGIDINSYSFPDYEPFGIGKMLASHSLVARYQYRYTRSHPVPMTLVAARGCPFNCSFCVHNDGRRYRYRSIQNILEEIDVMHQAYHFNILIILDELFAVNKDRLQEFSTAVLDGRQKRGWDFDWCFQTHASANLDESTLRLAKRAGCFLFSYGIESASPVVLASMNKKTRPEQIEIAIKLAEHVHIGLGGNFIFGDPAETPQTALESVDFYKKYCRYIHVSIGTVYPFPGSRLFEYCLNNGIIPDKLDYYNNINRINYNMTSLSHDEFRILMDNILAETDQMRNIPMIEAIRAKQDSNAPEREIRENGGKTPWELSYECPHCQTIIYNRELLSNEEVFVNGTAFISACASCHKRFIVSVPIETAWKFVIR